MFLEKNSLHLHYNFSIAMNKIQINVCLSFNFVANEIDIYNSKFNRIEW